MKVTTTLSHMHSAHRHRITRHALELAKVHSVCPNLKIGIIFALTTLRMLKASHFGHGKMADPAFLSHLIQPEGQAQWAATT